jgi:hypothetical protein
MVKAFAFSSSEAPSRKFVENSKQPLLARPKPSTLSLASVMFTPHPNLADDVNHAIIQSEIEGGVFLHDLPPSTVLHIQTMHHCYTAVLLGGSDALISGHPEFCPDPVQVAIAGSTWGGSMLKLQYVGRGMHLEFRHPEYDTPIVTSPIQEIRDSQPISAVRTVDSFRSRAQQDHSFYE